MTTHGIEEKNKLNSTAASLYCLDINIPALNEIIYVTNNNEDITWNGNDYIAIDFEIEDISRNSSGEIPNFNLKISNIKNEVGTKVRLYDADVKNNGYSDDLEVTINVVFSNNLDNPVPETSLQMVLEKPTITPTTVTFNLGAADGYSTLITNRILKNLCPWKFKDIRCGYIGSETSCNKTLSRCLEIGNESRFGGEPFSGSGGIQI